ncbi:rod shape determining protein [Liquorilactobacillus aquaticus DSM 21051]|uniref:Rod shape determining protein n=1 Tax=Liquorilactobacillus aquaticus DSM 21051 TaxID=1423725 RepID=A0A0R2D2I6_9LACO|nr:FtsW/RodA/SpoVE family cell cycle protein [Liquorilactobacillus aquaticus]KRM97562.1 rod shape determining protein [Liquorilactobacillus aquaticus DSM 21051]
MAEKQLTRADNDDSRIDYGIVFSVLILAVIGMASIYVAAKHDTSTTSITKALLMQVVWYGLGTTAVVVIMQFDAEQLWKLAPVAYGVGITLLLLVLVFYSRSYFASTGAKSWFSIAGLTFQPSEIMKPAYILILGRVVSQHNSEYPVHNANSDWRLLGKMFAWTLPIAVLLKLQNDLGTMLVFFAILGGVILVSGITWKIILPVATVATLVGGTAIILVIYGRNILMGLGFKSYQFQRIEAWLDPSASTSGSSYQLWQSMKAIGSGKLLGRGFDVSKVYVPVRESDMIFSVIGENFGFIGGCLLIFIYLLLIFQMIQVTFDTKNEFYAYISTGVIMMILFHVFENVGMSIGLLPLTGIPLPFISQGGSALIGNMIGIGLIMSMRFHNKSYMFSSSKEFH